MTIRCPQCGLEHADTVVSCDCGYDLENYQRLRRESDQARGAASRPCRFLPMLRILLRLLAGICLVGGVIAAGWLFLDESVGAALGALAATVLVVIPYLAAAEAITLLLGVAVQQEDILEALGRVEKVQAGEN